MAKRAKAATTDKRGKTAPSVSATGGASNRKISVEAGEVALGRGAEELRGAVRKIRSAEPGFGVVGMGNLWSLHSGGESQTKDRGIAPPALPVPIASFNI